MWQVALSDCLFVYSISADEAVYYDKLHDSISCFSCLLGWAVNTNKLIRMVLRTRWSCLLGVLLHTDSTNPSAVEVVLYGARCPVAVLTSDVTDVSQHTPSVKRQHGDYFCSAGLQVQNVRFVSVRRFDLILKMISQLSILYIFNPVFTKIKSLVLKQQYLVFYTNTTGIKLPVWAISAV